MKTCSILESYFTNPKNRIVILSQIIEVGFLGPWKRFSYQMKTCSSTWGEHNIVCLAVGMEPLKNNSSSFLVIKMTNINNFCFHFWILACRTIAVGISIRMILDVVHNLTNLGITILTGTYILHKSKSGTSIVHINRILKTRKVTISERIQKPIISITIGWIQNYTSVLFMFVLPKSSTVSIVLYGCWSICICVSPSLKRLSCERREIYTAISHAPMIIKQTDNTISNRYSISLLNITQWKTNVE